MNKYGLKITGWSFREVKVFLFALAMVLLGLILILSLVWVPASSAQGNSPFIWQVQAMESDQTGLSNPVGLTFASRANVFEVLEGKGASATTELVKLTPFADREGGTRIVAAVQNPINIAYDNTVNRLLLFPGASNQLLEVWEGTDGNLDPRTLTRHDIRSWGLKEPQGMAVDESGVLFILDAVGPKVLRVEPGVAGDLDTATVSEFNLSLASPRGIATDATTGHLHVMVPAELKLYELSLSGELVNVHDLAQFEFKNPQGMVFAPSGDQTDDPAQLSLFVADGASSQSTGQIVELSLVTPATLPAGITLLPATSVRTFNTSTWNHPSPDPAGVDYWPPTGQLLISDSEIEESVDNRSPAYWHGYNVFLASLSGELAGNCTTFTSSPVNLAYNNFSNEPTGVAINPNNKHIFFTNDGSHGSLFEVSLGTDGNYCTSDDIVTRRAVTTLYGATDAEDVAYGDNTVFISDGINAEVWVIPLGDDGVMSNDDGLVTHWDTAALGFHDLEGIGYNQDSGTLFIVSTLGSENYLGETTTSGTLQRAYNLSFMGTQKNIRSDVAFAPSSQNPAVKSIYIASRGIDNGSNRLENDGKVWEINISSSNPIPTTTSLPALTPTSTAQVPPLTPTNTPQVPPLTPTNTPQGTDQIFTEGFETGDLSAWSSSVIDAGDLSVSAGAALTGSKGLQAVIDDNIAIFATDDTPNTEPRYRVRFYFDPNSISMVSGDGHNTFLGYSGSATFTSVLRVGFGFSSGVYQVRVGLLNDSGTWINSSWFTISDAPHPIELDWKAATGAGANNGGLTFWIDGIQKANLTGVDNDTQRIDRVQLGAAAGIDSGTRGTYYFDIFESRRQTYVGP